MKTKSKILETTHVLGYDVFSSSLNELDSDINKVLINTISPNSYGLATKDKQFEYALKMSDLLVLDGVGIALGSLILNRKNIKKIAGQDCFNYFMAKANQCKWKVFFLGSTEDTLKKIARRAGREFPSITVGTFSPPYKNEFSESENAQMVKKINAFKPDVLFVGMTAPKQEKWAYAHKEFVNARIISTIGNVFDWYAGNSRRPAKIWVKLRLEWLVRIFLRPEILKRNTGNQLRFLRDLLLHVVHIKRVPS